MATLKYSSIEELEDKILGKPGTARRDAFETEVTAEIQSYHIGEAIRAARKQRNLSQEELGELMGVKKAQISRIESGRNITFSTASRVFHALGIAASLQVGTMTITL